MAKAKAADPVPVPKVESPLARAWRSFLSAIAADPVLIALVTAIAAGGTSTFTDNLVPVTIAVISAAIVGLTALALGYSEWWTAKTQTAVTKGVAQALQKFAASVAVLSIAALNSSALFELGDKLVAATAAAVVSGILTYALNRAQRPVVV